MPHPQQPRGLLKVFGAAFGLAMAVGATIGGGILSTPGDVAAALPTTWLFIGIWVLGGLNALMGATIYAELGTMVPRSGGIYPFAQRAFGDGVGFFTGYADWLNYSVASAGLILLVGEYLGAVIAPLRGHSTAIGLLFLLLIGGLQWRGVKEGGKAQEITSLLKTLALVALVGAAFFLPTTAPATVAGAPLSAPHGTDLILALGVAMQGVIFTYDSYYSVVYCSEEMMNPDQEIPRSVFRGLWVIIGIYLLLNLAFVRVLPMTAIAHNAFVGGSLAQAIFGTAGDRIIRGIMIVSVLGTANAQIIAAPRILLAMARDGLFPQAATRVNAGGTPHVALALSVAAVAGFMLTGSFTAAIALDSVFIGALYLVTVLAFFWLRRRAPDARRPYHARGYPWVQGAALVFVLLFLATIAVGDVKDVLITAGLLVVSWPASRWVRGIIQRDKAPSAHA
jgi:APA family basic amino acid/polyamine antiporter